jgi:prephenate dehydratase
MRISYLGPPGTFTEDALREAIGDEQVESLPKPTGPWSLSRTRSRER